MNPLAGLAVASLIAGVLSAIGWVVIWTVTFPGAWAGYGTFTELVFLGGVLVIPVMALMSLLSGR